jgi:hypothetical protein
MVTLRRQPDQLMPVVWGNADTALLQFRNALAWASAECGGYQVMTDNSLLTAAAFLQTADVPRE